MALFKIHKGLANNLPTTYNEGYCYLTTDDGKFYIDTTNAKAGRIALNAKKADSITYTNLGSFAGKTVADLRAALEAWVTANPECPGAQAMFTVALAWVTAWNNEDLTTTLEAGSRFMVSITSSYTSNAYC